MSARRSVQVAVTGLWRSPQAPTDLDTSMLADRPYLGEWLDGYGPVQRRTLWGRLDSQLLLGEPVLVHEDLGDWVLVTAPWQPNHSDPTGYPGFVRKAHLGPAVPADPPRIVVTVASTAIRSTVDDRVLIDEVSYGVILPTTGTAGTRVGVRLPDGRAGWLPAVEVAPHRVDVPPPTAAHLIGDAEQFLGTTYVAAGLHGLAYDCSGLVHAVYRRFGQRVPRDTCDMLAIGADVPVTAARAGDLLLFTEPDTGALYHVAIALDLPRALHVSESDWACINTPLTADRRAHLSHARRFVREG